MRRLALLTTALFLASAPAALAQASNAPPGNSGVDQYLEAVPSGSGSTSSKGIAAAKSAHPSKVVAKALSSEGSSGAELERLVAGSAPAKSTSTSKGGDRSGGRPGGNPSAQAGSGPVRAAAAATTGSGGGMGVWLPILLVVVALVAVGAMVARHVRRAPPA